MKIIIYFIILAGVPNFACALGGNFISSIMLTNQLGGSLLLITIPAILPIPLIQFCLIRYFFTTVGLAVGSFLFLILSFLLYTLITIIFDIKVPSILIVTLSVIPPSLLLIYSIVMKKITIKMIIRLGFIGIFCIMNMILWQMMFDNFFGLSEGMTPTTIRTNHILAGIMALIITTGATLLPGLRKQISEKN